MKSDHQLRVELFMRRARQKVRNRPTQPTEAECYLRARLILEEAIEVIRALGFEPCLSCLRRDENLLAIRINDVIFHPIPEFNLIEVVDGCCDLKVVTTGTLSCLG